MASRIKIRLSEHLTKPEAAIEKGFSELLVNDVDCNVIRYLVRFGRVVDTDRARELCMEYRQSEETRTLWSRATYAPAKFLSDEVFWRILEVFKFFSEPGSVMFTSGGSGSGKTTALAAINTPFDLLVDGTLTDCDGATEKIQAVIDLGFTVTVLHVYLRFDEAVRRVIDRAIMHGRAVTMDNLAMTHFRARETFLKLASLFETKANFRIVDSSDTIEELTLKELLRRHDKSLDEMRQEAHDLVSNEFDHLRHTYPEIYRAILQKGTRT